MKELRMNNKYGEPIELGGEYENLCQCGCIEQYPTVFPKKFDPKYWFVLCSPPGMDVTTGFPCHSIGHRLDEAETEELWV